MKYMVVFITGSTRFGEVNAPPPGTMIEGDRFDTHEEANKKAAELDKKYGSQGSFVIMPYYDVEITS